MQKKKYPGLFAVLTALLTMWNAGGAEMIDMSILVPADGKKDAAAEEAVLEKSSVPHIG